MCVCGGGGVGMSGLREIRIVIIIRFLFLSTLFYCEINCNQLEHGLYLRVGRLGGLQTTIAFFRSGLQLFTCMFVLFSVLCR